MKPSDFFVGAMDFFAILMPGALLAFLLMPWAPRVFGPVLPALDSESSRWIAFAMSAYLFGHLLHHMGSVLDNSYDKSYVAEKRRFGDELLLVKARELVKADIGADISGISIYSWAGSYVRANNPAAAAEIDRLSGDSKFFRSLCLVAGIAAVIFFLRGNLLPVISAAILSVFSYYRFCKQRWGSTQLIYEYFTIFRIHKRTLDQNDA